MTPTLAKPCQWRELFFEWEPSASSHPLAQRGADFVNVLTPLQVPDVAGHHGQEAAPHVPPADHHQSLDGCVLRGGTPLRWVRVPSMWRAVGLRRADQPQQARLHRV